MLTLYYRPECPRWTRIKDTLEELALAHETREVKDRGDLPEEAPEDVELPLLVDDGAEYAGSAAVADRLQELQRFKELWYKFQSDVCYCEEEGDVATPPH
jgi:glutaredoxin